MTKRVVVVGAGVIGLWIAYELKRRGMEPVVVDKDKLGSGSSYGNAGWVIPSRTLPLPAPGLHWEGLKMMVQPDSPLYIKPTALPGLTGWFTQFLKYCNEEAYQRGCAAMASFSRHAHAGYDQLVADGLEFEMHERGLLSAYIQPETMEVAFQDYAAMARLGLGEPQRLTAEETRELEPQLGPEVVGGIFIKEARHIDPRTLLGALAGRLEAQGVELRFQTEVVGFVGSGARLAGVKTTTETIYADDVVVATGAWAGGLLKSIGYAVPMQAGKGYSLQYDAPNPRLGPALFLADSKIACTPLSSGTRYAGTIEFSGINTHLDERRIEAFQKWIPRYLPNYRMDAPAERWVGMRPVTPDGLPVIGSVPGYDNVYVAAGHSTAGLALAPATAWRIADLLAGGVPPAGDPFDPARFGGR